jgi:D-erythrulose 1-phosphate 3-epimerase
MNISEQFSLGINTGFAVNRFSEHDEWLHIVGDCLDLRFVQLTADMVNVSLPAKIVIGEIKSIKESCLRYNVKISSTFTGAFTRVNHLAHPNPEIRKFWISWFKKFVDLSIELDCTSMGSHFGIFTHSDNINIIKRNERRKQNIEGWHEIADYAKERGLSYLTWEPMSVSREQGETIVEARRLQNDVNRRSPLPIKLCLDVDHGDVTSKSTRDTDPYIWLEEFADESPLVHLKQSYANKSGHWPFTKEHNKKGRITPEKVVSTLKENTSNPIELLLELSFREREPIDSTVVEILKESVKYWRQTVVR